MDANEAADMRRRLRVLLRVARFQGWSLDAIEDAIEELFRGEVDDQPAPAPDQLAEPTVA